MNKPRMSDGLVWKTVEESQTSWRVLCYPEDDPNQRMNWKFENNTFGSYMKHTCGADMFSVLWSQMKILDEWFTQFRRSQ